MGGGGSGRGCGGAELVRHAHRGRALRYFGEITFNSPTPPRRGLLSPAQAAYSGLLTSDAEL
jgi:hypothetical protein